MDFFIKMKLSFFLGLQLVPEAMEKLKTINYVFICRAVFFLLLYLIVFFLVLKLFVWRVYGF